ncbi:hypothetical protein HHL16_13925 [Pseudoflavitalea sp. G-6-1-2]|uniref:hypothetical protein n=1 Tax=Pseudoflavitalea sp. G-6-1-2 TaxID=2728841 RepID=UPI00146EA248|nr:hypothetical protein [Pseudoflavitalea sp. G-6-1-2]NML21983.1 hypothetical protein [Pseudoflavitalea sp. G-6-1-2]
MKTKQIIQRLFSIALLSSMLTACNKKDTNYEKAIHVLVTGYNGSEGVLQAAIDTTALDKEVAYGKYLTKANSILELNFTHSFLSGSKNQTLTLTDTTTNKVVFSKPLPEAGTKAFFNFVLIDGKELPLNPPAADASTNKIGFYIHTPGQDAAVDIIFYRKDANSETEYREYLARNVQPNKWVFVNYVSAAGFDQRDLLNVSKILFTKTGTTDQWAFNDDANLSKMDAGGMSLPLAGEKGLVLPYFIVPGEQLGRVRMFFSPDRLW